MTGWQVGGTTYDLLRECGELRAQLEDLRVRLAESEAENDQYQAKLTEVWTEVATLRAALEKIAHMGHVSIDWAIETAHEALTGAAGKA